MLGNTTPSPLPLRRIRFSKYPSHDSANCDLASISLDFRDTCLAAIEVPVSMDTPDYADDPRNNKHRSRPIVHWCTIDLENGSVDSSVTDIVSYELVDAGNNVTVAESDPSAFAAHLGLLSSGSYTLRLRTTDHTTYSGIIDL